MINHKKKLIHYTGASLFILATYFVYFFFYSIASDNYVFYKFTECNLSSILDYFLHYGNGRILGNIICAFLSHKFHLAPLFVSITMLSVFWLLNKMIFHSNHQTLLIISFLFIIADCLNIEGIYSVLPTFINYFFPILPFLLSLFLFYTSTNKKNFAKFVLCIIACFFAISSTLFSENTTIIFLLFSILINIYSYFTTRKININTLLLTLSLAVGAMILLALPHIFGVADKLDWYRGTITLDPKTLLVQTACVAMYTAKFNPLLIIISATLCIYITYESDKKANFATYLILFSVPLITTFFIEYDDFFARLILLALLCLYLLTAIYLVFTYTKKEHKILSVGIFFIIIANIGMCIFVDPIGTRVLYISYFFSVLWLLLVFKKTYSHMKEAIKISLNQVVAVILVLLISFVGFSVVQKTDFFNKQIYEAADEKVQSEIDLSEDGFYINKFIFAIKYHSLVKPQNGEKIFADNEHLWDIIEYLK